MRYFLAMLTGLAATLSVFAGGVAFAVAYLSAEPVAEQNLSSASSVAFSTTPRKINPADQNYERIASILPPDTLSASQVAELVQDDVTDQMTTASTTREEAPKVSLSREHVAWCSKRYRSYRPETNSYRSYSGRSRECVSPYDTKTVIVSVEADAPYQEASVAESYRNDASAFAMSADHVSSCFARYNSYRAEDNTYQPYGGGPRVQCE